MKSSSLLLVLTIFLGALSLIGFLGHITFKIMHWPGSGMFRVIGLGCAVLGFALFYAYRALLKKEGSPSAPRYSPSNESTPKTTQDSPKMESKPTIDSPHDTTIAEDIWEDDEE